MFKVNNTMTKLFSKSNLKFRLPKRNFLSYTKTDNFYRSYTNEHKQIELKYREPKPYYEFLYQGKPMTEQELLEYENFIQAFKFEIYAMKTLKSLLKLGILYGVYKYFIKETEDKVKKTENKVDYGGLM